MSEFSPRLEMNAPSTCHLWFPPTIPKRKHVTEIDGGCHPLSESSLAPRPTKRHRFLENQPGPLLRLAKHQDEPVVFPINSKTARSASSVTNLLDDVSLEGVYPDNSPNTDRGRSGTLLPPRGEVFEVNTRDVECEMRGEIAGRQANSTRVKDQSVARSPGKPTAFQPESSCAKRKRETVDEEHPLEKKEKRSWYEPEKDRIVVLDLDSYEEELDAYSPHLCPTTPPTHRTCSHTKAHRNQPEIVINSALMSHISSPREEIPSVPAGDDGALALVLYRPTPWAAGGLEDEKRKVPVIEDTIDTGEPASMELSPLVREDDNAMDIDS